MIYTSQQLAKLLCVSRETICQAARSGTIKSVNSRCGRRKYLFAEKDVVDFVESAGLTFPPAIRKLRTSDSIACEFNKTIGWVKIQERKGILRSVLWFNKRLYFPESVEELRRNYMTYEQYTRSGVCVP